MRAYNPDRRSLAVDSIKEPVIAEPSQFQNYYYVKTIFTEVSVLISIISTNS